MKKIKFLSVFMILIFASSVVFAGGGSRNGTAGASQLLIPVGARGIAMGSATLTGSRGIESIFWNPANLSRAETSTNVMFTQMSYIADINVTYGAVSTKLGSLGHLGLSIKSLDIGDIAVTTVDHPDGNGQYFSPQFLTLGLTYSKMLSDRISVGATANYISESMDRVSSSGFAFNIGINYTDLGGINGLSLAFAIKNLGPQMKYDGPALFVNGDVSDFLRQSHLYKIDAAAFSLPSTLELGLGYDVDLDDANRLMFDGVFQNSNFYGDEYKIGGEYSYDDLFFVRAGYDFMPNMDSDANIYGVTLGAGLKYDLGGGVKVKFDYAFRQTEFFNDNHVFSLGFGL